MRYVIAVARVLGHLVGFRRACPECRDPDLRAVSIRQDAVRCQLASVPVEADD